MWCQAWGSPRFAVGIGWGPPRAQGAPVVLVGQGQELGGRGGALLPEPPADPALLVGAAAERPGAKREFHCERPRGRGCAGHSPCSARPGCRGARPPAPGWRAGSDTQPRLRLTRPPFTTVWRLQRVGEEDGGIRHSGGQTGRRAPRSRSPWGRLLGGGAPAPAPAPEVLPPARWSGL